MDEVSRRAQEAANKKGVSAYVFRAVGLNGDEMFRFNFNGEKNSPRDELVKVIEPQNR